MRAGLKLLTLVALTGVLLTACADSGAPPQPLESPLFAKAKVSAAAGEALAVMLDRANEGLSAQGTGYRAYLAEYVTTVDGGEAGSTIIARALGNKQLGHDFVPGDPARGGRTNITYIVDQTEGAIDGLTTAQTTAAIDRAMATWNGIACSNIPITPLPPVPGLDLGVVESLNGLGGAPFWLADITHAGWLPGGILANNVIAVTFTFVWVDGSGNPIDQDNNRKLDVAFREILYNDLFNWQINGNIDVETVALHEVGHGLSQAHFGNLFIRNDGLFDASPRAVMNAVYQGVQQTLLGTDNGGHCSNWANWPQN